MLKGVLFVAFVLFYSANSACSITYSTYGVEVTQSAGVQLEERFKCLKSNGKRFFMNQILDAEGVTSSAFTQNYKHAISAGIEFIDAYATICNIDTTSTEICRKVSNALPSKFKGQVWLDISAEENCWTGSSEQRLSFVENVANDCTMMGMSVGIKSDAESWYYAFGGYSATSPLLKKLQLWYSDLSKETPCRSDFSDQPFGGWALTENEKGPKEGRKVKSYKNSKSFCGLPLTWVAY